MSDFPPISIVVPTYARTALLCEVVECFRRSTYDGAKELVILNDCEMQTLTCDVPGVRVLNRPTFPTFGDKVNALISAASHPLIMRVDDDDLFMPDTLTALADKLRAYDLITGSPNPVARFRKMLQWTGDVLRLRSASVHHGALIRRDAWNAAGGLKPLQAGYPDVEFWNRMTPHWFVGRWHHELDGHLLTIHRADGDRPHMEGADRVTGHPPLSEAEWQHRQRERIEAKQEPRGDVALVPSWSRDWLQLVNDFTAAEKAAHGEVSYG